MDGHWIEHAHIKKGALTREAAERGETVSGIIAHPPANASTKLKKRIALAKTFRKLRSGTRLKKK